MSSPRSLIIAEVKSSQSGARCADVRAVMPPAMAPRSTTITFWPSIASSYAVDIPAIPEPITIVSHDRFPSRSCASGATSMSIHSESQRLGTVVTFIAATGTVTPDVNEIGRAFPRRRRVVMVGNAKRDILVGEQSEYLWHIPARVAKFEAVSTFLRQQLEERCQPFGIGLKLRRQLKQDRAGFLAKQR